MYQKTDKSDSYSYIEFDRESELLIYKNSVSPFSDSTVLSFLRLRTYIYLFSFIVSIFPVSYKRSHYNEQRSLLLITF